VTSHLSLLWLAVTGSNISLSSVARVDKPYRHIVTRVDQTNILIGESARIRWIPKLEIATDDVEGGHSCKIHRLGGEALFYLQARGIDAHQGESLLLNSEILRHLSTLVPEKKEEQCHALHKKLESFRSPM
jgi:Fe-S cluster assembly scaffold protein SufB